jgi:F-type H+-transporting ATPase subunit delta
MSLTRSYAKAWVETMEARKESAATLDTAQAELDGLVAALRDNRAAQAALGSPATTNQEKVDLVAALIKGLKLSEPTALLLRLMADKDRLAHLEGIVEAIDEVRLEMSGGVKGIVESADPLNDQDLKDLSESFTKKVKKTVRFKARHTPSLLAGVRVTIQGVTYDGSLSAQLERVKDRLVYGRG